MKLGKRLVAIVLTICMIFSSGNIVAFATETEGGGESSNTSGITRIEWLQGLTEAYGMHVEEDNYPDNYYSDIDAEYTYYYEVMLATEFGLVDVEAGDAFCPENPATREFVAHTLNACMGLVVEDEGYTFAEAEMVTYPDDIQVAIANGWFEVSENKEFFPEQVVTSEEKAELLAIAQADALEGVINEEHEDTYELQADVIVIPETVVVEMIDTDVYTLSEELDSFAVGDKIAILTDAFPVVKKVTELATADGVMTIKTESVPMEEAFVSIDYEGIMSGDLTNVQTFSEDVKVTYVVGGTAEQEYEDGVEYESADGLAEEEISAVKLVQSYDISDEVAKEFDLGENATAQITCTISNPNVDYKVNTTKPYINFNSTVTFSCNVSMDVLGAINVPGNITLAKVPVGYVGYIEATLELEASGEATVTLVENVSMGVKWSKDTGFQMTKKFTKQAFTLQARVDAKAGVKLTAGFDVIVLKGDVYGEVGAKAYADAISYGDGKLPNSCVHLSAYMYAEVGCGIELDLLVYDKSWSKSYTIYGEDNSPVKIAFHYEDGVNVSACTRNGASGDAGGGNGGGEKPYKYYTPADSKYGYSGSSSGVDSSGAQYAIFEYDMLTDTTVTITKYNGNYASLSIPSTLDGYTVSEIASEAFRNHDELAMIVIPSTVTKIESKAFYDCDNLTTIVFSNGLVEIGGSAFAYCEKLTQVNLPATITTLGSGAFQNCTGITSIYVPKSLCYNSDTSWNYMNGPFMNCDNLRTVEFEAGIVETPDGLLKDCTGIREIVLPDTVKAINAHTFQNAANLKRVVIPSNVTDIDYRAFYNCKSLEAIAFPETLLTIGEGAFYNCILLQEITLPNRLTKLGGAAFSSCIGLTRVYIPKSLCYNTDTSWNYMDGPFMNCDNLRTVEFEAGIVELTNGLFKDCTGLREIEIPSTVKVISSHAFQNATNLQRVILPSKLTDINYRAFYNCKSLETIAFPSSLISIGEGAFYNCITLTEVSLPNRLTKLGGGAFSSCTGLTRVYIPKSLCYDTNTSWNYIDGPFMNCDNLRTVEFEAGIVELTNGLFKDCTGLREIELPGTVKVINAHAFQNATNLQRVVLPNKLTDIDYRAFYNCKSLEEIVFPDTLTILGDESFMGCSVLNPIEIPNAIETIEASAFKNCTSLESVTIPKSVTKFGKNVFEGCSSLKTVNWETALTEIPASSFKDCSSLNSFYGFKKIETIRQSAFRNCDNFVTLKDVDKLQLVEESAFYDCDALETVILSDTVTTIKNNVFASCDNLKNITLGMGIKEIASQLFMDCIQLENIVIPYNVTKIGSQAFKNDTSLTSVSLPQKTTTIDTSAFSYSDNVTIYGIRGSYAETFASAQGMKFVEKSVPATSVSIPESAYTIPINSKFTLVPSVQPTDFTDLIVFKTSNASVVTVSEDGLVTAKGVGSATIKIVVGNVSTSCKIQVVQPVSYVYIKESSISLEGGDSYKLGLTVRPDDAYNKDVLWESSDESVATVSEDGVVFGVGKGSCTITATAKDGSGEKDTCKVTVLSNLHIVTDIDTFESDHPYPSNLTDVWSYTASGAAGLRVTFDENTSVEEEFDYIYIYDGKGTEIGKYTGAALSKKTISVEGDTIKVKLVTDGAGNEYGFKVTSIEKVKPVSKYTIAFNGNGSTSGTMSAMADREYGKSYTLKANAFKRTGYSFIGWNTKADGSGKAYEDKQVVKNLTSTNGKTVTLYAQWKKVKYTITYKLNGGSNHADNPASYYVTTSTITLNSPTRKGYTFKGWYTDSSYKTEVKKISKGSTGNKTLYAKWTANKYNIKFNGNDATEGSMSTLQDCVYNKMYTLTANKFKRKGYTFNGWNTKADGSGTAYKDKDSVLNLTDTNGKTVTLYAQWKKVKYKITYKLNGGTNTSKNPASYYVTTSTITLKNPSKKGYTFDGWYSDSNYKKKVTKITQGTTGDKTLYAKWKKTTYTITYKLNNGKNHSSNPKSYNVTTSTITLKNPTRKGYTFKGWYTDSKYKNKVTKISKGSTGNVTLYAKWSKNK